MVHSFYAIVAQFCGPEAFTIQAVNSKVSIAVEKWTIIAGWFEPAFADWELHLIRFGTRISCLGYHLTL